MPEREQILGKIQELPTISVDHMADESECWESDENGAHFILTREQFPQRLGSGVFYCLSVSGNHFSKEKVIMDFKNVFGAPFVKEPHRTYPHITMIGWRARQVERRTI